MKMEREHKKLRGRDRKEDLVFDTFTRCIQLWNNGHQASFSIECKDGEAMMKFSAFLGSQENRNFVPTSPVTTVPIVLGNPGVLQVREEENGKELLLTRRGRDWSLKLSVSEKQLQRLRKIYQFRS